MNDPAFRERFVHKYRIIYRLETERILVVAVIHGSRQIEPLFGRMHGVQEQ
jgi:plasmid stabilization system protein ParE